MRPTRYLITHLRNPQSFANKVRRWIRSGNNRGYHAIRVVQGTVEVEKAGLRPWGELAGHMTWDTEILPQAPRPKRQRLTAHNKAPNMLQTQFHAGLHPANPTP